MSANNNGRQAIVAAMRPTIKNTTRMADDDATLNALWTGESADPRLSSRTSLRNLMGADKER